jgi:uncharacterized membrane protein
MGLWKTRCGSVVRTGYVVVVLVIVIVVMMMIMVITMTTTMICNFTLVFALYCQDETKCSIETGFKIPFEGFFVVVHETANWT